MSAEVMPPALQLATERRLTDFLDNPESDVQDLDARHTAKPGDPDMVGASAGP